MGLKQAKYINQYDFSGGVNLEKPGHLIAQNECFANRTNYDETLNCYWDAGIKKRLGTNRINTATMVDRGDCENAVPPMLTTETVPYAWTGTGDYTEMIVDGDCEAATPPTVDGTPSGYSTLTEMIDNGDCESYSQPIITGETIRQFLENATFERSGTQAFKGTYSWKVTKTSAAAGGNAKAYLSGTDPIVTPVPTYGAASSVNDGDTLFYLHAAALDDTHIIAVYRDDEDGYDGFVCVGTIVNKTITWGEEVEFYDGSISDPDVVGLDSTHAIIVCKMGGGGQAIVATISDGDVITLGDMVEYTSDGANYNCVTKLDSTHFAVAWNPFETKKGTAIVGVVSGGNVIAFGSASIFNDADTGHMDIDALDSTHIVVVFGDDVNGNYGRARVALISGTTISSWGAESTFQSGNIGSGGSVAALDSTHFVTSYMMSGDSYHGYARIAVISGTTISSWGTASKFEASMTNYSFVEKIDSTHFIVAYKDEGSSNNGTMRIGLTDESTAISSWGTESVFDSNTSSSNYEWGTMRLDSLHFVVFYRDADGDGHGEFKKGDLAWNDNAVDDMHGFTADNSYYIFLQAYTDAATASNVEFVLSEYYSAAWNDTTIAMSSRNQFENLIDIIKLNASTVAVKMYMKIDTAENVNKYVYIDELIIWEEPNVSNGFYSRNDQIKSSGSYSWRLIKNTAAAGGAAAAQIQDSVATNDVHGFVAGKAYEIELSLYTDASTASEAKFVVSEYYSGSWHATEYACSTSNEWNDFFEIITLNGSTAGIKLYLELDSAAEIEERAYIDNLSIEQVSYTTNGYWDRTNAEKYAGSSSWILKKISEGTGSTAEAYLTENVDNDDKHGMVENSEYTFEVAIHTDAATPANVKFIFSEYYGAQWNDTVTFSPTAADVWQKKTATITTNASMAACKMWVEIPSMEDQFKKLYIDTLVILGVPPYILVNGKRVYRSVVPFATSIVAADDESSETTIKYLDGSNIFQTITGGTSFGTGVDITMASWRDKLYVASGDAVLQVITSNGSSWSRADITGLTSNPQYVTLHKDRLWVAGGVVTAGYQEFGLTGKTGGTATGLSTSTQYYFKVAADGGSVVEYEISTAGDVTYAAVIALLNTAVTGVCTYSLVSGDLRCTSDTTGASSTIAQSAGQAPDLAGNLTNFTGYDTAVVGGEMASGYLECCKYDDDTSWAIEDGEAFNIGFKDGDPITALKSFKDNLICYKNDSIWVMKGDNLDNWFQKKEEGAIGCIAHLSIADVGLGHIFLGPDNIYFFNGVDLWPIGNKIKPWLDAIPAAQRSKATSCYYNNYYRLSFAKSGSSYNDFEVILDLRNFKDGQISWWPNSGRYISTYIPYNGPDDANTLYICDSNDGYLRQVETGTLDDNANYDMEFHTKYFTLDAPNSVKIYDRIKLDSKAQIGNFTIDMISGLDDDTTEQFAITSGGSGVRDTSDLALPSTLDGMAISYKITHSEDYEAEFYGFTLAYKYLSF